MNGLMQDLRYGLRKLARTPGFTLVAVLTLALGIGVNTSMFSVVNGIFFTDLPYRAPDRLVLFRVAAGGASPLPSVSPPEVIDFRERLDIFESVASIRDNSAALTGNGEPVQIQIGGITWNFLSTLGLEPILGRGFNEGDAVQGVPPPVIISHGLWQRKFGGDPNVVGKTIQLDGNGSEVIGILGPEAQLLLPREAGLPVHLDAWRPFGFDFRAAPRFRWMRGVARLKPGVTYQQAQEAMDGLAADLIQEVPTYQQQPFEYVVAPLHEDLVRPVRAPMLVLFGAVAFVLLIACANVANLLLARAAGREQEVGVRSALGANRWRLVRQMLTESLLLGLFGGAGGFLLAQWGLRLLLQLAPSNLPRLDAVAVDLKVFGFALMVSLVTVVLFGLIPALQSSRADLVETMKSGMRSTGGVERARLRKILVAAEIALSLVLLVGAGLMMRSFLWLQQERPGFEPGNLVTYQLDLPGQRYQNPEDVFRFFEGLSTHLASLPGIEAVGGSFPLPMTGRFWTNEYGFDEKSKEQWGTVESDNHIVLPGYFESVGAKMVLGRTFTWADNTSNRPIIIVDDTLARKAWPGENPIGKRLEVGLGARNRGEMEVVGVVAHIRQDHPGTTGREQTYMLPAAWPQWGIPMTVRSSRPPDDVMSMVTTEVRALDPQLAISKIRTMREWVGEVTASNRFAMVLMGTFAVLAAVLAGIGLYGTISYSVVQRNHEIGVRMALGATRREVFRLVLSQGFALTLIGILVGNAAAVGLTRFLSSLLFGVQPIDFLTYGSISLLLTGVSLMACLLPAFQATRVQPIVVLRYE